MGYTIILDYLRQLLQTGKKIIFDREPDLEIEMSRQLIWKNTFEKGLKESILGYLWHVYS